MTDAATRTAEPRLIGAWRLAVLKPDAGPVASGADGLIVYDAGGFMSAHIWLDGAHHAYFGPFSVDTAAAAVTHHRVVNTDASAPKNVIRDYTFLSDDELVLAPRMPPAVKLTFRRVKGG